LTAYNFDRSNGDRTKNTDGSYADPAWSAADKLDALSDTAISNRKIYTIKGTDRFEFTYSNLNTKSLISTITSDSSKAADLINFLRGDRTNEGSTYRTRASRLGDIVNSSPLLVLDGEDASYDFLPAPAAGSPRGNYRTFLAHKTKRKGLVFVGANDGMLHAFDSSTGNEVLAYVPKTVLGNLNLLTNPQYAHRYFVDGPMLEADVYDSAVTPTASDTGWRNIVIGTGGAGGRNIFAIQVPVVSTSTSDTLNAPGASDILWEKNSDDTDFSGLGYVLQKPAVGMMRDGTWVVVAGNGYVNSGGTAKLYIINALTGAVIKTIEPSVSDSANNGLGGVRLVLDSQRQITGAYAGDLLGNLWKFDFSDTNQANWAVAFGGKPFFQTPTSITKNGSTTTTAQPITVVSGYLAHPLGGNLVIFGTGKLFEDADTDNTKLQSLYAVWDKVPTGQRSSETTTTDNVSTSTMVSRSSLVEQTMTSITNTDFYSATNKTVNYATKRGWFIDLNMSPTGLRMVYEPQFAMGKVFLQTLSPKGGTTDACTAFTGRSVNFVVNSFSGSASSPTFDLNKDGKIDDLDASDSSRNAINAVAFASNYAGQAIFSQRVGFGVNSGVVTNALGQKILVGTKNTLRRSVFFSLATVV
jgi:type IV pilus assembly protein PilY1